MFAALLQESAMKESTPQGGCSSSKGTTGTSKFGQIVLGISNSKSKLPDGRP